MIALYVLSGACATGLMIYLIIALLYAEEF